MGIDVTSGPGSVKEKLNIIREKIEKGKLGEIKYLISERSNIKGWHGNIPSFIVGADPRTTHELAELWLTANRTLYIDRQSISKTELEEIR